MKTKDRILEVALTLYNAEGIRTVTTRHIAAQLGISAGNLHYHFKHTEDIIQALFEGLIEEFDRLLSLLRMGTILDLDGFEKYLRQSFHIHRKYSFLFLHFVEIGNWIPAIRDRYFQLTQEREVQFLMLFQHLSAIGVFRVLPSTGAQKDLVRLLFIVSDFWLAHNALTERHDGEEAFQQYKRAVESLFKPYMA
ncbi:TetR/AcrR family transcriptional regulator [Sphingobacterium sp. Mn56C]|uniref:TetR/AcrR family transcriptional regulator n=1 Tax=Sphingobacterium sp. Mn56C TaxID=3395261 RepID=UPI003BDC1803